MPPTSARRPHYLFAQGAISAWAGIFLGYRSSGSENVPAKGPFLLAASHKSYLDPPLIGSCIRRELRYFSKRELFANPLFGWLIRAYGAVPVERVGADRRALSLALEILAQGQGLLVFPEGTRIRRPGVGEAKPGIGMLAVRSRAPVIPVWAGSTWAPRRSFLCRVPVHVRFGAPLHFLPPTEPAAARRVYEEATATIMAAIAHLGEEDPKIPG